MTFHGLGVTEALAGLPAPVYVLFAILTQLGDVWFLFLLLTLLYWFGEAGPVPFDRRRGAFLLALGLCALGSVYLLKHTIAIPRPPGAGPPARGIEIVPPALRDLYTSAATGDGYGFPSGHAMGSTLIYSGLAWTLHEYAPRDRLVGAAAVVATIALSRLVLGVHHLLDVGAGILGGLVLLGVALWFSTGGERPGRVFLLAVLFAVLNALVAGGDSKSMAIFGASVGGTIGWVVTDRPPAPPASRREALLTVLVGFPLVAVTFGVAYAATENPGVLFLAAALSFGLAVWMPTAVQRWRRR